MAASQTKVFGSPGTGKTSWLEKRIAKRLKFDGVKPEQIGAFTFTKNEARRLRSRVAKRAGVDEDLLDGISTIHSRCYQLLKADGFPGRVVTPELREEFAGLFGFPAPQELDVVDESGQWLGRDQREHPDYWTVYYQMVTRHPSLAPVDALSMVETPGYWTEGEFLRFCEEWAEFKLDEGLLDFSDMPRLVLEEDHQVPFRHLYFDEFQDCFPLLWMVAQHWCRDASEVVWAGDPNQCIYTYMGCMPALFRGLEGQVVIRRTSRRVPSKIWTMAKRILQELPAYTEGDFPLAAVQPTRAEGELRRGGVTDLIDLVRTLEEKKESTFILARTNYQVRKLAKQLAYGGVSYTSLGSDSYGWPDTAMHLLNSYIRLTSGETVTRAQANMLVKLAKQHLGGVDRTASAEMNKMPEVPVWKLQMYLPGGKNIGDAWMEAFDQLGSMAQTAVRNRIGYFGTGVAPPNHRHIRIGTGHSAKGSEAMNVIVYDRISPRMAERIGSSADAHLEEARVWYVICTRAKRRLYVLSDQGGSRYPIPEI